MNRRNFVRNTLAVSATSIISIRSLETFASTFQNSLFDFELMDSNNIIPAPNDPDQWQAWRGALNAWKTKKQSQLKYDGRSYSTEAFNWVTADFACCFIMMCDKEFYDHKNDEYLINNLIFEGKVQYGGYDSVVLWHAYPRIGLDDRNQFDFYRDMPHGLEGLKEITAQFHLNNIKVFIPYYPWDKGTRREPKSDLDILVEIIKSIDADGIFLDTMKNASDFRDKLDATKPGVVMEGELALPLENLYSNHASWAQEFKDSRVPGVYRNKWFERSHMLHAINRCSSDKTPELQTAWMNGSGMLIWENIFGLWIGWNERDKSIYRSMSSIQRHFRDIFSGNGWTPLSMESPVSGIYISLWESGETQLWTLVNRNEFPVDGVLMKIKYQEDSGYFDLIKGEEVATCSNDDRTISFPGYICGRGIGCFLRIGKSKIDGEFNDFIFKQKRLFQLYSDGTTIPIRNNHLISKKENAKQKAPLKGMIAVPAMSLKMYMEYTVREVGAYSNIHEYLAVNGTNEQPPTNRISKMVDIKKFAIDETPVTNSQFKKFLDRSGYKPLHNENFLKHWTGGNIPSGKEEHPVVYIDLEDARAYSRWTGKRLPTEEEWQFAAQGSQTLDYPWGNDLAADKCNQNTNGETTSVKAFPGGRSPFGCYDMCGNTWELTCNEYSDGRTRFVMLKGGSCYKANGSGWYTDGGPQKNNFIAKMLLMWSGLDRCATIGFRCVIDL